MWARKRIDIGWSDLASAAASCLVPGSRSRAMARAEDAWAADTPVLACLSVRSGLDLLLTAMDWPPGSEVIMSAVNIEGMVRVVAHHRLKIVPVDLRPDEAAVDLERLEELITPNTRAVVVAQLLGVVSDLTPLCEIAHRHQLMVVEDCAQAFAGTAYRGHPQADVSLFSFGPIKTATALGGALLTFRSPTLRNRLRDVQAAYPVQSRWKFLRRIAFYSVLRFLGQKRVFAVFVWWCLWRDRDLETVLNGSVRNFPGGQFMESLRHQPNGPLLRLLLRRIRRYPDDFIARRTLLGRTLCRELGPAECPGSAATFHSYWLAMVKVQHSAAVLTALRQQGFDATQSNALRLVSAEDSECTVNARAMLQDTVYLPIYAEMPPCEMRRMAACLLAADSEADRPADSARHHECDDQDEQNETASA